MEINVSMTVSAQRFADAEIKIAFKQPESRIVNVRSNHAARTGCQHHQRRIGMGDVNNRQHHARGSNRRHGG